MGDRSLFLRWVRATLSGWLLGVPSIVRSHLRTPMTWLAASVLGWALAGGAVWAADALSRGQALRGLTGALAYLGLVATGGLSLGLVTGVPLLTWPRPSTPSSV